MKVIVVYFNDFIKPQDWRFVFTLVALLHLCIMLSIYNHNFSVLPEIKIKNLIYNFNRKPETSLIDDDTPGCRDFNLTAEHLSVSHLITRVPQVQCDTRTSQWKYAYKTVNSNLQAKISSLIQGNFSFESCCFHTFHLFSKYDGKHEYVDKIDRISNECSPIQDIGTVKALDIDTIVFGDVLKNNWIRREFQYIVPWIAEPAGEFLFINSSYSVKSKLFQRDKILGCKLDVFYEFYCFCL